MAGDQYQFDDFTLDGADRRLCRGDAPVELSNRYFDALLLLVREQGRLVSKDMFMAQVWQGIPVTDEALTQCIRTLRRQLGDDAARPRFIETVPKHGYRFIAPVGPIATGAAAVAPGDARDRWHRALMLVAAGAGGGGMAGIAGGLFYAFAANLDGVQAGIGATSVLVVLLAINMLVGLVGGGGIGLGLAAAQLLATNSPMGRILGAGIGGLATGAVAKLIGLDAFRMLLGEAPGRMTGAAEGASLGLAVGLAAWLADRGPRTLWCSIGWGALTTGAAGLLVSSLGGQLLGGSLASLLLQFPGSHFRLDAIGAIFGEAGFGAVSKAVTGGIEGLLFGACLMGSLHFAQAVAGKPALQP